MIMKNIYEFEFENEYFKKRNRELHRRLQQKESPWQSEVNSLRLRVEWKERSSFFVFGRLCMAHDEMKDIFKMVAPLYNIPCKSFHSVMDSNFNDNALKGTWANVIVSKYGPIESYNIIDTVKKLVDEVKKLRGEK